MLKILARFCLGAVVAAGALLGACDRDDDSAVAQSAVAQSTSQSAGQPTDLAAIIDSDRRSEAHRARNIYRHPAETLTWFGLRDDMTVVEVGPGGFWYTGILAPYLAARGKLYLTGPDPETTSDRGREYLKRMAERIAADPGFYGSAEFTVMSKDNMAIAPDGSADMVLTFRNVHSWMGGGYAEQAFAAYYQALKPGGILGLVEHRGDPAVEQDPKAGTGYVRQDYVVGLAEAAGFELVASSEINANPKDSAHHPFGVWTLPPTLDRGDGEGSESAGDDGLVLGSIEDYRAIGESDRMTLKFVKPAAD